MSASAEAAEPAESCTPPAAFRTALSVLDSMLRAGMRHAVLAPGSRSAPLAYALVALAEEEVLQLHVRLDERTAGFMALGLAKATGEPAGVVTTSGTAVGELMPAVMEAALAEIPLAVLSADRPPRLRGTGANQTTWQPDLFGTHVRAAADLTAYPEERPGEQTAAFATCLAALAGRAVDDWGRPSGLPRGPVQINTAFDEPLTPDAATRTLLRRWAAALREQLGPLPPAPPRTTAEIPIETVEAVETVGTVVLAGDGAGETARRFAEDRNLPLLAEPSSGARRGPQVIGAYRLILGRGRAPAAGIDRVVLFGRPTLSRPVAHLLNRPEVEILAYRPHPVAWAEPGCRRESEFRSLAELAARVGAGTQEWNRAWKEAEHQAQRRIRDQLETATTAGALTGIDVARAVWSAGGSDGHPLVIGSSNPIRDLDLLPACAKGPEEVFANRGLAGIDGTIATAIGIAAGLGRPVRALLGDLTFLHDLGSLLILEAEPVPDLQILVFNDSGGGIFSTLEHAGVGRDQSWSDAVERLFGTPHRADLRRLVEGYGHRFERADTVDGLEALLAEGPSGLTVIEIPGSREGLADLHRRLQQD